MSIESFLTYNCDKIVALCCNTNGADYKVGIHLYKNTFSSGCTIGTPSISNLLTMLKSCIQSFCNKTIYIMTDLYIYNKDIGDLINIINDFFYENEIECLIGTYDDFKEYLEKSD